MSTPTLPQDFLTKSLIHFENGVPIDDLNIRPEQKRRLARVSHVYWQFIRNPFLEVFPMFKQLVKGQYADLHTEWRAAQKDKLLFDFIVDRVSPPSRKVDETKVRWAADKAMKIGSETDDWKPIIEGAKVLTKVARLDQPENQQSDLSKAVFLPPVVTTSAHEVDDTKEDVTDEQALLIMKKYGAHIDEKRKAVEDRVEVMLAARDGEALANENGNNE